MAIETTTDLSQFFDTDDFALSVTFTDPALGTVRAMADNAVEEIDIGVLAENPILDCRTSDIVGVVEGSTLTIEGVTFTVLDRKDDGTGITTLELSKGDASVLFTNNFDESAFFETDTFAQTLTVLDPDLGAVQAIVDTDFEDVDVGGMMIEASHPIVFVNGTDISGVGEGSLVSMNGTRYQVRDRINDGTGMSSLQLKIANVLDLIDNFFRPDGVSAYFRPDGASYYLRAS